MLKSWCSHDKVAKLSCGHTRSGKFAVTASKITWVYCDFMSNLLNYLRQSRPILTLHLYSLYPTTPLHSDEKRKSMSAMWTFLQHRIKSTTPPQKSKAVHRIRRSSKSNRMSQKTAEDYESTILYKVSMLVGALTVIHRPPRNKKNILAKRPKARRLGGEGKLKMPTAEQMWRKEEKYRKMESAEREICEHKEAQKWQERFERLEAKRFERKEKERQRQIDARQDKLERQTRHWMLQALPQSAGNDIHWWI